MSALYTKNDLESSYVQELIKNILKNQISTADPHRTFFYLSGFSTKSHQFSSDLIIVKRASRKTGEYRYDVFSRTDALGAGKSGKVYPVILEFKDGNKEFAMRVNPPKVIKVMNNTNTTKVNGRERRMDQKAIENETATIRELNEGKAHAVFEKNMAAVVMKKIVGDNLRAMLDRSELNFAEMIILANRLVADTIEKHDKGYVHGDVKSDNCMASITQKSVALTDFGFTVKTGQYEVPRGTPAYAAPELFQTNNFQYTVAVDKYAVAGVLAEIFGVHDPFVHKQTKHAARYSLSGLLEGVDIDERYRPAIVKDITRIIQSLSDPHADKRMDLREVKTVLDRMENYCLKTSAIQLKKCADDMLTELNSYANRPEVPANKKQKIQAMKDIVFNTKINMSNDDVTWESYERSYLAIQSVFRDKEALGGFRGVSAKRAFNLLTRPVSWLLGVLTGKEKWLNQGFVDNASLNIARRAEDRFSTFSQRFFQRYSSRSIQKYEKHAIAAPANNQVANSLADISVPSELSPKR